MLVTATTKHAIKTEITRQLDRLHKDELIVMRRHLAQILAHRLVATATAKAEQGALTSEAIHETVLQHRRRHPYQ